MSAKICGHPQKNLRTSEKNSAKIFGCPQKNCGHPQELSVKIQPKGHPTARNQLKIKT